MTDNINISNKEKNDIELENKKAIEGNNDEFNYLYPSLDDPFFSKKIAERKEFYDTRYEKPDKSESIQVISDKLCNADFELTPHQMFVRNFMSFQTPYNGLLLYHGLGSGKTCSAISISEEMREYMKQIGSNRRIMIVASPNVQQNFKLQLFDERKLTLIDGLWNIKACTGNKYLKEINPMNMKGFSKEKVIMQIKRIISNYYVFMGYVAFANYISDNMKIESEMSNKTREEIIKKKLNKLFNNRLVIIDEVHNIRISEENKNKRVAMELLNLVNNVDNMRLLLLSATPMYNSYKEIIWLINLLNINDNRSQIQSKDVFDNEGNFKLDDEGNEIGKELLVRKSTGYISFVRGENPYTFPFRIWPDIFKPDKALKNWTYPSTQLNGIEIFRPIEMLSLYMCNIGNIQQIGYNYIISNVRKEVEENKKYKNIDFENMDRFGYTLIQRPIEALNIIYPHENLHEGNDKKIPVSELVGTGGLSRIMKFEKYPLKLNFEYKEGPFKGMFKQPELNKYSGKINNILNTIIDSTGVILIYSQYIDGGIIPIGLALEELGFKRAGSSSSLFKDPPSEPIDSITFKTKSNTNDNFSQAAYIMITGDPTISTDNVAELKLATNLDNINGEKVKVILISQAGSEGLDFKFIRQVHILEPWYNMNRIEQIIGRAVRTCSHKSLSFENRNVEIYLYASIMEEEDKEAVDLYVYRVAEKKAVKIGTITRLLKETAVDCLLNYEQTEFTIEDMNMNVGQILSSGKQIEYQVGDRPYSAICDYMDKCSFKCKPIESINNEEITEDSYNESFIVMNNDKIIQRIKDLFKDNFFYDKVGLVKEINIVKNYPLIQINSALSQLIDNKNEFLIDMYGRLGRLVNISDLYLYQPLELTNKQISTYDRTVPIDFKNKSVMFELEDKNNEPTTNIQERPAEIKQKQKEDKSINKELSKGNKILDDLHKKYLIGTEGKNTKDLTESDDWYLLFNIIKNHLMEKGIKEETLNKLLIDHLIESLRFDNILELLNYIENSKDLDDSFVNKLKEYFENIEIKVGKLKFIELQNEGASEAIIYVKDKWEAAKEGDYEKLIPERRKLIDLLIDKTKLGNFLGFMSEFKKSYMVFKVKDINLKRNIGARCDQASKSTQMQLLNNIGAEEYIDKSFKRPEFCVLQEMILRFYNEEKYNKKRWFLTPAEAIFLQKIDK